MLLVRHFILARVILKEKKVEVWDSLADEKNPILQSSKIVDIVSFYWLNILLFYKF